LISRILGDASYLRAIFGSLSIFTVPIGIFLGVQAIINNHMQPMPPSWKIFVAMTILGVFDATSGLAASIVFSAGVLISGNIHSLENLLSVFALAAICASPAVIAGSFRPLRRKIGKSDHAWERIVDYLFSAVLTGWTLSKFVGTLNVIAGKQLAIVGHATAIGIYVGIAVILRLLIEDVATYFYPSRSAKLKINAPKPSTIQQLISLFLKGIVFALVMKTFVGFNIQLLIGTFLFVLPGFAKLSISHHLPKSALLHLALPKGGMKIVAMTLLGTLCAALAKKMFTNVHDFITWGFVLLSLPSFILSVLELLSDQKRILAWNGHAVGKWMYRLGGVVVFYLIVEIVSGHNLLTYFSHMIS
jgi:hypothetical protein